MSKERFMKRIFSRHSLNVFEIRLEEWPYGTHTHNFCELILVKEGSGFHTINEARFPFSAGDVFLLTPSDAHDFEIIQPVHLLYIKFTELFFQEKSNWMKSNWVGGITYGIFHSEMHPGSIIQNIDDRKKMFILSEILLTEFVESASHSRELVIELMGAILILVYRNLKRRSNVNPTILKESDRVNAVLAYVRQHIGREQPLNLLSIAEQFGISVHYVSEYLLKHTGKGFKRIVQETRIERAIVLLKQSTLSISEIADRVGFSDASHMNKTFQRYCDKNPTKFRTEGN